jgi:anion-transporting  ArsA/GET3 family ATPase
MTPSLDRERLIVVTGKGGVGKTTVTAALGHVLSSRGRRVLLLEADQRESLHVLCGTPPSDGAVVTVTSRLSHRSLRPRDEIEALLRGRIRIPLVARAVSASPVFRHFVEAAPGLKELAVLGHALRIIEGRGGPGADAVILDAPASGHGLSLLEAPGLTAEALGHGPVADLAREIADLIADRARTAVVVVTLAEELPVQETIELLDALDGRLNLRPALLVANQLYPAASDSGLDTEAAHLLAARRAINRTELARLRSRWPAGVVELPLLPCDPGPALSDAVGRYLEAA